MNIQLGLERISAVWWGFWGLMAVGVLASAVFSPGDRLLFLGMGTGGIVVAYVAHRLTCWFVSGFFVAKG